MKYYFKVKYQIKNFIDKNKDLLYQDFKRLLYNSENSFVKKMWPEGAQSINEITKRPTSVATRFKNSMIGLVQNLSTKVIKNKLFFLIRILIISLKK